MKLKAFSFQLVAANRPRHWLSTKTANVMKLTFLFLTVGFLQVSANSASQTVSFSGNNVSLPDVFAAVKQQTGYVIFYDNDILKDSKPVSVNVKDEPLTSFLSSVLRGQSLGFSIKKKTIVISKLPSSSSSSVTDEVFSSAPIRGKVLDSLGRPLSGATVSDKNNKVLGVTDAEGVFNLNVTEGDVLFVSYIGYESRKIVVTKSMFSSTNTLVITLSSSITKLEEVKVEVNTGYQRILPNRFVGSYSQLDSATYSRRAGMNILDRLDGSVTGILFDKKSGQGQLQNIQIRGVSTLDNPSSPSKSPLIIVDNFPYTQDLSLINPNDVESITVLKDAAAASIWGARAGNGVVVITTKKGRYNQPLRVSVSSDVTVQGKPNQYYYPQMSTSDFIDAEIFLFKSGRYTNDLNNRIFWPAISPVVEILNQRQNGDISASDSAQQINGLRSLDIRRDLDKYVYQNSVLQRHYVNLSGGTNVLNYSFSGGYNRQVTNIQGTKPNDQFTVNTKTAFRPTKFLGINGGVSFTQNTNKAASFSLPTVYPYAQLADALGNPLAVPNGHRLAYLDSAGGGKLLDWKLRPLDEIRLANISNTGRMIMLDLGLSLRITNWLRASASYQYSIQSDNNRTINKIETYYVRDLVNQYTNFAQSDPNLRYPVPLGGILSVSNVQSNTNNARARLDINKTFGSKHVVSSVISGDISETTGFSTLGTFYGYDPDLGTYKANIDYVNSYPIYGGALGTQRIPNANSNTGFTSKASNRFVSVLANANYTYDNRYTLYVSGRKEGANVFGVNTNKKWQPLWSAGASWDISRESFYSISWMPQLKFSLTYGYTGVPGNITGLSTINYNSFPALYTNLTYANVGNPPNPDLRWEKQRMINAAADFSVLQSRLSGRIEVFKKNVTDLISSVPFAPSTGVATYTINSASLRGHGFEINLNSKNVTGVVNWQTSFGLTYTKMLVDKLFSTGLETAKDFVGYGLNAREGQIAYALISYKWAGLNPLTGDPQGIVNKQVSTDYGTIANDSIQNQVFHGSSVPLYFGNLLNTFSWKNFSLSANIIYRLDFYYRKPTISYSDLAVWKGNADYGLRWQKSGDEAHTTVPSFTYPLNANRDQFYQFSEVNVLRGDNVRLQDIRLQYDWNSNLLRKISIQSMQLFVYANNLNFIIWKKDKSELDPDYVGGSNFLNPTPKTWTGGVMVNF